VVAGSDVEIEAWHVVLLAVLLDPRCFNLFIHDFSCVRDFLLLFVIVKEPRALFDNGCDEILTMHASSVLIGNEYLVWYSAEASGESQGFVVLVLLNHFDTFVSL
jgi:hypothetical protein